MRSLLLSRSGILFLSVGGGIVCCEEPLPIRLPEELTNCNSMEYNMYVSKGTNKIYGFIKGYFQ